MTPIRSRIARISSRHYLAALAFCLTFFATMAVTTVALSLMKVCICRLTALAILVLSAVLGWLYCRAIVKSPGDPKEDMTPESSRIPFAITVFAVGVYLVLWIVPYVRPDITWDGNMYHIPPINEWAVKGHLCWMPEVPADPIGVAMNGFPKGAELVSYVMTTALGNCWKVHTANQLFLPMGVLALVWMTRTLGARSEMALLCGAVFMLVPVSIKQSASLYVDVAEAACVVAVLVLLASILSDLTQRTLSWKKIPLLGMALGLAISIKQPAFLLALIAGLGMCVALVPAIRKWDRAQAIALALKTAAALTLVAIIVVGIAGYWYVRNYVYTGTPLYPVGVKIGSHTIFPGTGMDAAVNLTYTVPERLRPLPGPVRVALNWIQNPDQWPRSIIPIDSRLGGLGYLWLLGCVPAMALVLFRRRKFSEQTDRTIWILVIVTMVAFVIYPMNWWARHTFWIYAAGLPCLGLVVLQYLRTPGRPLGYSIWLGACLAILVIESMLCMASVAWSCYPEHATVHAKDFLKPSNWKWPACYIYTELNGTSMQQVLTGSSPVAFGPCPQEDNTTRTKSQLYGVASQPIGRREVLFLSGVLSQENWNHLRQSKVRYVIWDDSVAMDPTLEKRCTSIKHIYRFLLLELDPDKMKNNPNSGS